MIQHFPDIVDIGFTADMEQKLDAIEEGRQGWTEFLRLFYDSFRETLARAESEMPRAQKPVEEIDEQCPECGRQLVIRSGRFGPFISCSGFPECSFKKKLINKTGALCPNCGGDLVERKTKKRGKVFYGCVNYPTCNFATWDRPVAGPCPNCGGLVTIAQGKRVAACTVCGTMIEGIGQEGGADGPLADMAAQPNGRFVPGPTAKTSAPAAKTTGTTARRSAGRTAKATTARGAKSQTGARKAGASVKSTSGAKKRATTGRSAAASPKATTRRRTGTSKETIVIP
jgi:DNA topoisomerase-1